MTQNSYDLNNGIRDVSPAFDLLISQSPSFLKLLGSLGTSFDLTGQSPIVKANKYEWVNESLTPFSSAIASFAVDGDGVTFDVASTTGFEAGSIVRFEAAAGNSKTELARVTSVNANGTSITVSRDYGSTTGVTLIVGDIMFLNSTPQNEASSKGSARVQQGTIDFNYTEIFRADARLSRTAIASRTYDGANSMQKQIFSAMVALTRKIEGAALYGVPVARTDTIEGTTGGLLHYLGKAGGNIDSTGGNISQTLINNVIESIYSDGGALSQPVILCAPNQARRLSALNTAGTNPILQKSNIDRSLGNFVTSFVGDLPIDGSGVVAQIYSCFDMAKDKVAVVDLSKVNLRVMSGLTSENSRTPGDDNQSQSLVTELTLEVENSTKAHGIITGLNI